MISIIVCSVDQNRFASLEQSIADTIGCDYELIVIDNREGSLSIFEAYNKGIERSKGDVLCFSHEDLIMHTNEWGIKVYNHFNNPEVGAIGICGGTAFPSCPAPWWNRGSLNEHRANNIDTWPGKPSRHNIINPENEQRSEVVVLDGAWICIRKSLFNTISFDDNTFKGFHAYDSDICLQVRDSGFKCYVIHDVLLEHFSPGVANPAWFAAVETLADKWAAELPQFVRDTGLSEVEIQAYEETCLLEYIYNKQSKKVADKTLRKDIAHYTKPAGKTWASPDGFLLYLWSRFGFAPSKVLFRFLKPFISKYP